MSRVFRHTAYSAVLCSSGLYLCDLGGGEKLSRCVSFCVCVKESHNVVEYDVIINNVS